MKDQLAFGMKSIERVLDSFMIEPTEKLKAIRAIVDTAIDEIEKEENAPPQPQPTILHRDQRGISQ